MLESFQDICKELGYKDEELLKVAKKLSEGELVSCHISSVMIVCRLNKCNSESCSHFLTQSPRNPRNPRLDVQERVATREERGRLQLEGTEALTSSC